VRDVTQEKWFRPVLFLVVVGLVYFVSFVVVGPPDYDEAERVLVEKYDLRSLEWETNGSRQRDTLVLDGQDVSDACVVEGEWGSLDDVRIDCDEPVGIRAVDEDQ